MEIPEEYQLESCDSNNSIWTVEKIRKVFEMLQLTKVMDIYDENNNHIMTLPNQNSKRGGEALFSKNINISSIIKEEKDKKELTSFIKYNMYKLKGEIELWKLQNL